MGLTDLLNAFKSLNIETETVNVIERTKDRMVYLNKSQLNLESIDSKGNSIKPKYFDREYAVYKQELNPFLPFGAPDLNLTGAFYSGFYATIQGSKIEFGSTDEKTDKLTKRYGKNIFGLTQENKDEYATETVRPKVVEYVEKITGLKAT